jgi:hypothetical protein
MSALITAEGLVRLDAALAWIEQHPEQHRQDNWITDTGCGTAYCLAGAIVHLAGAEPVYDPLDDLWPLPEGAVRTRITSVIKVGDERWKVSRYALELLGIDADDDYIADELFDGSATLARLREVRDSLAASLDAA